MKPYVLYPLIFSTGFVIALYIQQSQAEEKPGYTVQHMYAPWRSTHKKKDTRSPHKEDCVFCKKFAHQDDEAEFIIKRYKHHAICMNMYPYNPGHILIVPFEHVASLDALSVQARAELIELINSSVDIVKTTLNSDGINVGINLGKAAGASVPNHLHIHIVPRNYGDAGFIEVVAHTIVCSFDLADIYKRLKEQFDAETFSDSLPADL